MAERRKAHRDLDEVYNQAQASGERIVGYTIVVQCRHPDYPDSSTRTYIRAKTTDPVAMAGHLHGCAANWLRDLEGPDHEVEHDPRCS